MGVLASVHAPDIARLRALCEQHRDDGNDKLRALAREFLLDWDVILRQVSEPQLPLTNNAAEQALRYWVIARRISMGTHSESGTRAFALLASVMETCRKRPASSWTYIASVIAAARRGLAVPALPAIPVGV
jgi:transposase